MGETTYPILKEEQSKFSSISDIPLCLCTISVDSKTFLVYDIENNKICAIIPNPVPYDIKYKGFQCAINGSQLFYFGGLKKTNIAIEVCLLIDVRTQSVEILGSGSPECHLTPVYFENFVYVFGGGKNERNGDKFNLRKKKWKRIADMPETAKQASTVVYARKILISGVGLKSLLQYDPDENSYESLIELSKDSWKALFAARGRCFVVTSDRFCYSSDISDTRCWNYLGKVNWYNHPCSNICYFKREFIFFDRKSKIIKFDIKNLMYKIAAITTDTLNFQEV